MDTEVREILLEWVQKGLSHQELAEQYELLGSVKSIIFRARKKLERTLTSWGIWRRSIKDNQNSKASYILDEGFSDRVISYVAIKRARRRRFLLGVSALTGIAVLGIFFDQGFTFSGSILELPLLLKVLSISLFLLFLGFVCATESVAE